MLTTIIRNLIHQALLFCLVILTACSSQPVEVHYYQLNIPQAPKIQTEQAKTSILVKPVELARVLTTGGLVTILNNHSLHISKQHRWGNDLSQSLTRYLVAGLAKKTTKPVEASNLLAEFASNNSISIKVYFDNFSVTEQNQVLLSGNYWLLTSSGKIRFKNSFNIAKPLTADGYDAAIEALQNGLAQLAAELATQLN